MIFKNRKEAGEKLATLLQRYKNTDTVVLALPRGGVVVGQAIAQFLKAPLDIVVPRKIGAPENPEYAIGAITETGEGIFNEDELRHVDPAWLKEEISKEKKEAIRRLHLYRGNKPPKDLTGKTVILVDDGIATGYTMRAALRFVQSKNPAQIIVAVPHGAKDSVEIIKKEVDEVVAISIPTWYGAVGAFYEEFSQVSDEEVIGLLKKNESGRNEDTGSAAGVFGGKSTRQKKFFLFVVACSIIFVGVLINEIYFSHTQYEGAKTVEIPSGLGSRKIGTLLKQEGAIRSKWVFVVYTSVKGIAARLKPGTYVFVSESISKIAQDLVRGVNHEKTITIPEGWSIRDIEYYFAKEGLGRGEMLTQFFASMRAKELENDFLFLKERPREASFEGYLFPDTYRVFAGATNEDVVRKMLSNFYKKISPDWRQEISRQKKTLFEILIFASLIEEEVRSDEDRALVSGILQKRLALGIPLQVDATIQYIKSQNISSRAPEDIKILIVDTKINSPYNTYQHRGLPPGPIANPGISAIKAAIFPKNSPYLYYLSAPDGRTIFSRTLEEHNIAKAKYLK